MFKSRESKENLVPSTCAERCRVRTKQRYVQSVLEALEKRTVTSSQSGGQHRLTEKGTRPGIEGWREAACSSCGAVDGDGSKL